jgi:CreA protein
MELPAARWFQWNFRRSLKALLVEPALKAPLVEASPAYHMGAGCGASLTRRARPLWEEDRMHWLSGFGRSRRAARAPVAAAALVAALAVTPMLAGPGKAADEPDLIFRKSTVFHWVSPNDKLGTYAVDDPEVEGVACHFTVPEKGGFKGWVGVAEEVSDISLACRQTGPIRFKDKFAQGDEVFRQRRSLFFKKMQIVRGCDVKRNVLVYVVYSDRIIEGSPKNSTSTVPIMPWGAAAEPPRCADFLEK